MLMRAPAGVSHLFLMNGECLSIGSDGTIWLTELGARPARAACFVQIPSE